VSGHRSWAKTKLRGRESWPEVRVVYEAAGSDKGEMHPDTIKARTKEILSTKEG
jgi:hypothetical protein